MAKQQETSVWKRLLIKYSPLGYRLFRNQRYRGPIVRQGKITDGWTDCGLCDGMGDIVGYKIVVITAEMIGRKIAQFCTFETKTSKGIASPDQKQVINTVINDGGIAKIIRPDDLH